MSSEPTGLSLRGLTVSYGEQQVVRDLDLDVAAGTITAVLGPSGCGKSTLLRAVGGLLPLAGGAVCWDGSDLAGTPPHRRGFGLMFQDHALFAHRNVAENIEFGLRMQRRSPADRRRRVEEILTLLDLDGFGDRAITTLSGGEAQRVALGRALAPEPRLLMLDEPLASLDRGLSQRLAVELRTILSRLGMTALYVTHDQQEAFAVAASIAIMSGGRITALGTPQELREQPVEEQTARFLGLTNIYDVLSASESAVETPWGRVRAPEPDQGEPAARIVVRPEAVQLTPGDQATVAACTYRGEFSEVVLDVGSGHVMQVFQSEPLEPGSQWDFRVVAGGTAWIRPSPIG